MGYRYATSLIIVRQGALGQWMPKLIQEAQIVHLAKYYDPKIELPFSRECYKTLCSEMEVKRNNSKYY